MPNACFVLGTVESEPELTREEDGRRFVTFKVNLYFEEDKYGWIKVCCLEENAEMASRLQIGMKVVVIGGLLRPFWKFGQKVWRGEPVLVSLYLEIIE